jgi:hypothetical protein
MINPHASSFIRPRIFQPFRIHCQVYPNKDGRRRRFHSLSNADNQIVSARVVLVRMEPKHDGFEFSVGVLTSLSSTKVTTTSGAASDPETIVFSRNLGFAS